MPALLKYIMQKSDIPQVIGEKLGKIVAFKKNLFMISNNCMYMLELRQMTWFCHMQTVRCRSAWTSTQFDLHQSIALIEYYCSIKLVPVAEQAILSLT